MIADDAWWNGFSIGWLMGGLLATYMMAIWTRPRKAGE